MRLTRIQASTKELDEQEHLWWNEHSALIETIWANSYALQQCIRSPYLNRMKTFFMEGTKKRPLRILELGCGTGWVCRLVGDENFHILGTDFSESQIQRAREEARKYNKDKYCHYELSDGTSIPGECDGIVIHAFLHHLTVVELESFFKKFAQLKKGTRIFMCEPVFLNPTGKAGLTEKIINRSINLLKSKAFNRIEKLAPLNVRLSESWQALFQQAQENNWYISPKEVPFYEEEIEGYLNKYGTILNKYIVNRVDLDIAQKLILHDIQQPGVFFTKFIFPVIQYLDRELLKRNFRPFLYKDQHVFVCYELEIK